MARTAKFKAFKREGKVSQSVSPLSWVEGPRDYEAGRDRQRRRREYITQEERKG